MAVFSWHSSFSHLPSVTPLPPPTTATQQLPPHKLSQRHPPHTTGSLFCSKHSPRPPGTLLYKMVASSSDSDDSSSSSSSSDAEPQIQEPDWACNEGSSSEEEFEAPAAPSLRGQAGLVTAACPRQYPAALEDRRRLKRHIPEDFTTDEFLTKFRRVFDRNTTVNIEKATCHNEPHKRFNTQASSRTKHTDF